MLLALTAAPTAAKGVGAVVSGIKSIFQSSDPKRDKGRCDTAARAVEAALTGARSFISNATTGATAEPVQWVKEQKSGSASATGRKCYEAAWSAMQNAGVVGVAVPTGNGRNIAMGNPVGNYTEASPGSMTPTSGGALGDIAQAGIEPKTVGIFVAVAALLWAGSKLVKGD